jgi:hypothetical protein
VYSSPSLLSLIHASLSSQDDLHAIREHAAVKEAWSKWLRSFRWDYWCSGTWTPTHAVTGATALRTVKNWLGRFPESYAAVGLQHGPTSLSVHVHIVVGGVGRKPRLGTFLRRSWVKHGDIDLEPFIPSLGGVEYLVGQAVEIELIGSPVSYKPRTRGRRGRKSSASQDGKNASSKRLT